MAIQNLERDWFYSGRVDFEQKKYLLLAYLQYIDKHFGQLNLYPGLSDLIFHQKNIKEFLQRKEEMNEHFPKRLESIDMKKLRLAYKQVLQDHDLIGSIEQIAKYALPRIRQHLENGVELYEYLEKQMDFEEIGVIPMYRKEGYIIIANGSTDENQVYAYQMNLIQASPENLYGIRLNYLTRYARNLMNTFESIKRDLIQTFRNLPNPATFGLRSDIKVPVQETLLPITQRLLLQKLVK